MTSPGKKADAALTLILRAGGLLVGMVVKRSLTRKGLAEVVGGLDQAVGILKEML